MKVALRRRVDAHHFDVVVFCEILDFVDEGGLCYDELGGGGGGLLGDLGGGVEGVGGGDGGAAVGGTEEGEDELGAVLEEEEDDVALLDAELVEAGGDFSGGEFHSGVGEGLAGGAVDEAGAVLELGQVLEAVCVEREVRWDVNVGEFRTENELVAIVCCRFHFCVFSCLLFGC